MISSALSLEAAGLIESQIRGLPQLPAIIRYEDDFLEKVHTLRTGESIWKVEYRGRKNPLSFDDFPAPLSTLIRHWCSWSLSVVSAGTTAIYHAGLRRVYEAEGVSFFETLLSLSPMQARHYWHTQLVQRLTLGSAPGAKSFLIFLCVMGLGQWTRDYRDYASSFSSPHGDKYAAVRAGDVFLAAHEEALIVDHLDSISAHLRAGQHDIGTDDLRAACILVASYQLGMRPIQIARVKLSDVRIFSRGPTPEKTVVHVTFMMAKQRSAQLKRMPMPRRIKREWAILFVEFYDRRSSTGAVIPMPGSVDDAFFGLTPDRVAYAIARYSGRILDEPRSATEFRHTSAQRLVDAGASAEELATFMGHAWIDTGLVYFSTSLTQAERLNKAMAISPLYQEVVKVARTKTIDMAALLKMPPDRQIGGAPHGIPIAGIGACTLGQSLCVKNPVLSCYGCVKFLAINEPEIHVEVRSSFRGVVRQFYDASRGESGQSSTYQQLTRTLEAIQQTITDIDENAG
ncbi:MAG TPA: site-specific integrase [Dongiaceae bacterium]|nr:site-specific integrase [Dongiaceae bacterium]